MSRNSQLHRFLQLVSLLSRPAGATIDELAETLGVARRTVYRDLDAVADCGLPVEEQDDWLPKRWRIREDLFESCRLMLEPDELLLLHVVAADSQTGLPDAAQRLLSKVRSLLPTGHRVQADSLRERVLPSPGAPPLTTGLTATLSRVLAAVADHRRIVLQYRSRSPRGLAPRSVEPHGIVPRRGVLYLLARPAEGGALRSYRLDRILAVQQTAERFLPVEPEELHSHFESRFGVHGGREESVEIWFDEEAAEYVRERSWHGSQEIEERDDGCLLLRMRVSGLIEVKSWVQSFGASATVLRPRWLAGEVAEEARVVAARAAARRGASPPTRRAARGRKREG